MKLPHSFARFLRDRVNLNQTRVDQANDAFDTLTSFLENHDDVGQYFLTTSKQGSLNQGTIIKPRKDQTEFDVDMLFQMTPITSWAPIDYLDAVHKAFKSSDRYRDLVDRRGKHRCVTIDYAGDFHVDIVPSIEVNGNQYVMNRETGEYEITDGDGYARWFHRRHEIAGGRHLVRVTRLMKYMRDEHEWPVKSILLTTLLGMHVLDTDTVDQYSDVPTSLVLLMARVDDSLQRQLTVPLIANPALPIELFTRHWDVDTYHEFRDGFHEATRAVKAAFAEQDLERSLQLWRQAFGEDFPLDEADIDRASPHPDTKLAIGSTSHVRPVSDIATQERLTYTVRIDGALYDPSGKVRFRGINSGVRLHSGLPILYKARTNAPAPYDVRWQVVNTGAHAARENGLRGGFFVGRDLNNRPIAKGWNWERTKYTGSHWIECFILSNGVCIARSGRFLVNIKNPSF